MKGTPRQLAFPGCELQDYVNEAIAFLRQHEPPEGYFVGFSGGKDSITVLHLCKMAGVKAFPYYSCTRIDPPEMYPFIKKNYPEAKWLFPKETFWKMIRDKQPPMRHIRWCCTELKHRPSDEVPLSHRLMGIRTEESTMRANRPRIDPYKKRNSQILYKPIFRWPEWAVWEFIEAENLPYPNLYDEGFNRIGCVCCPFLFGPSEAKQKRLKVYQERWSGFWKVFKKTCYSWFEQKCSNRDLRPNQTCKTADEFWHRYMMGGCSR